MGESFTVSEGDVPDGDDFVATKEGQNTEFVAKSFVLGGEFEIYWERDTDGDGNYEVSVLLDTLGQGISTGNDIPVDEFFRSRLRCKNVSGDTADISVMGERL